MQLSKLLSEALIISNLKSSDKYQVIEELIDHIDRKIKLRDKELAMQNVVEREQYLSTGLENGLAVPHGKTRSVSKLILAFGISKKGVDFDSLDGKKSHHIFLILSPKNTSGPHIQILAKITKMFKKKKLRESMLNASSTTDIIKVFQMASGQN